MRRMLAGMLLALVAASALASCGKKASPVPPGPPDQITYPKFYPSQ